MKKSAAISIISIISIGLIIMFILSLGLSFYTASLESKIFDLNSKIIALTVENTSLQYKVEKLSTPVVPDFKRVTVTNNFWEFSNDRNSLCGTIFFDDLSIVENISVSYVDEVFNNLSMKENNCLINREQNTILVSCLNKEEQFTRACVLDIDYIDGRSETIYVCICRG